MITSAVPAQNGHIAWLNYCRLQLSHKQLIQTALYMALDIAYLRDLMIIFCFIDNTVYFMISQ